MTGEQEDLIRRLKSQVHLLMAKYSALKNEFGTVIIENQDLREQVDEKKIRIERLEQQYNTAKVATGVLANDNDNQEAKAEINKIVREIDDCIALLTR